MSRFIMAAATIENILYFSDRYSNGLYQLNLENAECSFIDYFFEEKYGEELYFQAYPWEKKIYFIPGLAEKIACFDTISKKITYIHLPLDGNVIHGVNGIFVEKFYCLRDKNILWMMPVGYDLFLKFDLSNEQLYKIDLPESLKFVEGIINWRTSILYGKEMIFQPWAGTIRVHYDTAFGTFKLEESREMIRTYWNCFRNENYEIYVPLELKKGLLIKKILDGKKRIILLDRCVEDCTCLISILVEDKIYLIPVHGKYVISINISDFSIQYIDLNKKFNKDYLTWKLANITENKDTYYLFSASIPQILEISKKNQYMRLIAVKEGNVSKKKRFDRCIENFNKDIFLTKKKAILTETKEGLEELIFLANWRSMCEQEKDSHYGKIIYENLKRGL